MLGRRGNRGETITDRQSITSIDILLRSNCHKTERPYLIHHRLPLLAMCFAERITEGNCAYRRDNR